MNIIVGAQTGLGKIIYDLRSNDYRSFEGDIRDRHDIDHFVATQPGLVHNLIYTAGVNRINEFDKQTHEDFWDSMHVNCWGFIKLIQALRELSFFNIDAVACLVTSNAANVPMRHSLSYNCSKAAANMAVKQMAREIHPSQLTIFGVAPNKLAGTPMSTMIEEKVCAMRGWTPEEAHQYQVDALPARKETDPTALAHFILEMMDRTYHPYIHGNILPFGGPV